MKKYIKYSAAIFLFASAVALAATWGPFLVATFYPAANFDSDRDMSFAIASTVPRLVMQNSVQNIKKGDFVRIIYPDGRIYDFKTKYRCSAMTSLACSYEEDPEQISNQNQKHVDIDRVIDNYYERTGRDICSSGMNYVETVDTGYWGTSSSGSGNVITISGHWVSTGTLQLNRGTLGCR